MLTSDCTGGQNIFVLFSNYAYFTQEVRVQVNYQSYLCLPTVYVSKKLIRATEMHDKDSRILFSHASPLDGTVH